MQRKARIDPWFLRNVQEIVAYEDELRRGGTACLETAKAMGFSDVRIATLTGTAEEDIRVVRGAEQLHAVYKKVDTCGAEFAALTPYFYSSFDTEDESDVSTRKKIIILGGGPNRIGQGIEFDYCCVHAAFALKDDGFETIMVNCNPETVSTDYDTSDRLYFEPLTLEDVLAIVHREKPDGVIVQFGGQTPLKLAVPLAAAGVPIIGTSPDSIDRAEDRERFDEVLTKLNLLRPDNGIARSQVEAIAIANRIGYPVLVRPSYVLGGRAMEIIYEPHDLERYVRRAFAASPDRPLLIDRFLEDAIEVDVDAVSDGRDVVIGGIMEHIERAGVHSGDSACALPPTSIDAEVQAEIRRQTIALARELGVVGLMNVQYAVQNRRVFILEVNPRASRTVPFVSKAIGVPLAKIAARVMAGKTLVELGFTREIVPAHVSVKEAVFPFLKFPGVDTVLGPEMKSTGEVMGIGPSFGVAFAKAEVAAGTVLPSGGTAFISVRDEDRPGAVVGGAPAPRARLPHHRDRGDRGRAHPRGHRRRDRQQSIGREPARGRRARGRARSLSSSTRRVPTARELRDSFSIRRTALERKIPYFTTIAGALAAGEAIGAMAAGRSA